MRINRQDRHRWTLRFTLGNTLIMFHYRAQENHHEVAFATASFSWFTSNRTMFSKPTASKKLPEPWINPDWPILTGYIRAY